PRGRARAGGGFEDLPRLEAEPLLELARGAPRAPVGRDLGRPQPLPVGVAEEIVARANRAVDEGRLEAGGGGRHPTCAGIRGSLGGDDACERQGERKTR